MSAKDRAIGWVVAGLLICASAGFVPVTVSGGIWALLVACGFACIIVGVSKYPWED